MGRSLTILLSVWMLAGSAIASQSNIYVAQTAAGADDGSSVGNAHAVTWLNTQGHWGAGGTQAGAGSTIRLSGVITGDVNTISFSMLGSGTVGSPITVHFETGSILKSPAWAGGSTFGATDGAINVTNCSYVTIDGGVNGVITNTSNGTGLQYSNTSCGVFMQNCLNGIILTNLIVDGIYKNGGFSTNCQDIAGQACSDIQVNGNMTNCRITQCTLKAARIGVNVPFSKLNGLEIDHCTIADHCWQIAMGTANSGDSSDNIKIHDNTMTDWGNWWFPGGSFAPDTYHTDGIIYFTAKGAGPLNPQIYNNYIYGDLGFGSPTAFVFCTGANGVDVTLCTGTIYNNLLVSTNGGGNAIWISAVTTNHVSVYNNTVVCLVYKFGSNAVLPTGLLSLFTNNIFSGVWSHIYNVQGTVYLSNSVAASDNNLFNGYVDQPFVDNGTFRSLANWQSLGYDTHSQTGSPNLSPTYTLQAGSAAIANGANLSSIFTTDATGATRAVPWDIGAYAFSVPVITVQPSNQTVTAPGSGQFSVVATGPSKTYQWYKNSVAIVGANSTIYITPPTTYPADNGAVFYVIVSNPYGSAQSVNATLTVNSATGNRGQVNKLNVGKAFINPH